MPIKFGSLSAAEAAGGTELRPEALFSAADFAGQAPIIAAVSGGGDSLALLFLLHDFLRKRGEGGRLRAITVEHGLRAESAAEAAYVGGLCAQAGIAHYIMPWRGEKPQSGLEAAARAARYALLAEAAAKCGADYICTGHNLEDQAETYYMRARRLGGMAEAMGAAAADGEAAREADNAAAGGEEYSAPFSAARAILRRRGLACMAGQSLLGGRKVRLVRPLLGIHRADLRRCLARRHINWLEDLSNYDCRYERVRLRQSLNAEQVRQAARAAAAAAEQRQALSEAAAELGRVLHLQAEKRRGEMAEFRLDLSALPQPLSAAQLAALYLLMALGAAICGRQPYIRPDIAGLWRFLPHLAQTVKGENPRRISAMSAMLEKRRAVLCIRPEQRRAGDLRQKAQTAPFSGIIPDYDAPLYYLFSQNG